MPIPTEFEGFLGVVCTTLAERLQRDPNVRTSIGFQDAVEEELERLSTGTPFSLDPSHRAQVFPDFSMGEFGVEVKFSEKETWRSIANSIFEGQRHLAVRYVYVIFGKVGTNPDVRFARYEDCVVHVRTSHVPRFEVDLSDATPRNLFRDVFGLSYAEFAELDDHHKMEHVRDYARSRRQEDERLWFWWLEDAPGAPVELDVAPKLYTDLSKDEKLRLRAEAALLNPTVVAHSRVRGKYRGVALYLITYRGVLAPQARDLFTAGSATEHGGFPADSELGDNYVRSALKVVEAQMLAAAAELPAELFVEYWGENVPVEDRVRRWLQLADEAATDWVPSQTLFLDYQAQARFRGTF